MRLETKIAAMIAGLAVIGVGIWYVGSGDDGAAGDAASLPTVDATDATDAVGDRDAVDETIARRGDTAGRQDQPSFTGIGSPPSHRVSDIAPASDRPAVGPDSSESGPPGPLPRIGLARPDADSMAWPQARETEAESSSSGSPAWTGAEPDRMITTDPGGGVEADRGSGFGARHGRDTAGTDDVEVGSPWLSSGPGDDGSLVTSRPAASAGTLAASESARTHTIEPGDTFSSLAARYLGHAKYAGRIIEANPNLDPRRLRLGAKVKIPPAPVASAASPTATVIGSGVASVTRQPMPKADPPPPDRSYTVQPGEGWWRLAEKFMGKGSDWPELYELNKERVSGNSRALRVGTVIEIPARANTPK